jgi:lactate dehydrogenase-like 2-hydroxyacid dehydrogenase
VILPHIGSASYKTRATMALLAADNLIAGVCFDKEKNLNLRIEFLNVFCDIIQS